MSGFSCRAIFLRRQRGFTLIELLIALALIGLIVTMLFGAIQLGNRSWNSTERHAGRSAEIRLIWRFLGQQLEQGRLVFQGKGRERRVVFSGLSGALELVAPSPPHLGLGGLYLIRLQVRQQPEKKSLLLSRWLYDPDTLKGGSGVPQWRPLYQAGEDSAPPEGEDAVRSLYTQTTLIDLLESIEISYFGRRQGRKWPEWDDEWTETGGLPQLVKIQIQDQAGSWPEMVWALPDGQEGKRGRRGDRFLPTFGERR